LEAPLGAMALRVPVLFLFVGRDRLLCLTIDEQEWDVYNRLWMANTIE
jgi:hypothetical protein